MTKHLLDMDMSTSRRTGRVVKFEAWRTWVLVEGVVVTCGARVGIPVRSSTAPIHDNAELGSHSVLLSEDWTA